MALIYAKTAEGRQEIEDRMRKLPVALRSVLLQVNGERDEVELTLLGQGVRAPDDVLAQLLEMGLIMVAGGSAIRAPAQPITAHWGSDPERLQQLRDWMAASVRKHLGLKGYLLQLKVERCGSAVGLEQLWPEISTALGKAKSPAFATRWLEEVRQQVQPATIPAEPAQA